MTLSAPLRKVASKIMARFGGDVTIRVVTPGAYNTTTGAITETVSDTAIKGVLENVSAREVNELVQASDKRLIVAAADTATVPSTADRVIINSISHQIIRVDTIEQDNEPITYELILRT
jgi:outer membrane lipoprotein SlyB